MLAWSDADKSAGNAERSTGEHRHADSAGARWDAYCERMRKEIVSGRSPAGARAAAAAAASPRPFLSGSVGSSHSGAVPQRYDAMARQRGGAGGSVAAARLPSGATRNVGRKRSMGGDGAAGGIGGGNGSGVNESGGNPSDKGAGTPGAASTVPFKSPLARSYSSRVEVPHPPSPSPLFFHATSVPCLRFVLHAVSRASSPTSWSLLHAPHPSFVPLILLPHSLFHFPPFYTSRLVCLLWNGRFTDCLTG